MNTSIMPAAPAHNRKPVHTLQLWLNLPKQFKMVAPRVYSGILHGVRGPAENHWPTTVIDVRFQSGGTFVHNVPERDTLGVYIISGQVHIDGTPGRAGQMVWSFANDRQRPEIRLHADTPAHIIAYSSKPIGESFVQYGPFVMNTEAEIQQAFADLRAGAFGTIPAV